MAKVSPRQFFMQVKSEVKRVIWPTRKETFITTTMVFVLASFIAIFFFIVDKLLSLGILGLLGLGS